MNGTAKKIEEEKGPLPMGTATGEEEHAVVGGGWQGTDDATSTAPADYENPPAPRVHTNRDDAEGQEISGTD